MKTQAVSRRTFLAAAAFHQQRRRPPNVLLLLGVNWAYPHAGAYGGGVCRTPNFDRLANEGVVFTHALAPNPSCSPSRSSLLAGQESHRLGEAASLYGPIAPETPLYTDLLTAQGYFTGFSVKGFGPGESKRPGRVLNPAGAVFKDFDAFLGARNKEQPFCFWFGSHDPHVPWDRGRGRRAGLRADKVQVPPHLPDHPVVRGDILDYHCEVEEFDAECGRMLQTLERKGELDNTLVIMTSDNGWQMPRGLANCYDLGVRIPLAMRLPERIRKGQRRDDFVSIADLAPAILEAAGVARPRTMTAASLFGASRRDAMFLERERHANVRRGNLSYPVRGIRTAGYLYLRNLEPDRWPAGDPEFYWAVGPYGDVDNTPTKEYLLDKQPQPYFDLCFGKRPAEELYDLRKDPGQVKNVAGDNAYGAVKRDLGRRVDEWMKRTADPRAGGPADLWDRAPYTGPKFKGRPAPGK